MVQKHKGKRIIKPLLFVHFEFNFKTDKMNNLLKIGVFGICLTLISCGSGDASGEGGIYKIDTKDIKGEIDKTGGNGGRLSFSHNGKECEAYKIEIGDEAELMIYTDNVTFEEVVAKIEKKVSSTFDDVEIISQDEDCLFFKETKVPFGEGESEPVDGFGIIRVVEKDGDMNYVLESNGKTPLDPVYSKENADKLLKMAKSFVPSK